MTAGRSRPRAGIGQLQGSSLRLISERPGSRAVVVTAIDDLGDLTTRAEGDSAVTLWKPGAVCLVDCLDGQANAQPCEDPVW